MTASTTGNWARLGTSGSSLAVLTQGSDLAGTSPAMFLKNNGYVGIGTINPTMPLEVYGGTAAGLNGTLRLSAGAAAAQSGPMIEFHTLYGSTADPYSTWRLGQIGAVYEGGTYRSGLVFRTNDDTSYTTTAERMRIDGLGRVGIGTTTPNGVLEVSAPTGSTDFLVSNQTSAYGLRVRAYTGNVNFDPQANGGNFSFGRDNTLNTVNFNSGNVSIGTSTPQSTFTVKANTAWGWPWNGMVVTSPGSDTPLVIDNSSTGGRTWAISSGGNASGAPNKLNFYDYTAGWTRMVIDANGNVGIGSTAPTFLLDVGGNSRTTGCYKTGTGGGSTLGGTCSSDARLKKDIAPITGALDRLSLLRPVQYHYRADEFPGMGLGTSLESGLIAQELRTVYPDLVSQDDSGFLRVNYGLTLQIETMAAVKELREEKDAEIAALRDSNARKDGEIDQLKARLGKAEAATQSLTTELCHSLPDLSFCKSH